MRPAVGFCLFYYIASERGVRDHPVRVSAKNFGLAFCHQERTYYNLDGLTGFELVTESRHAS